MIVEGFFCAVGIGLTIPSIVAESSEFSASSFATWVRILPQFCLLVALFLRFFKRTYVPVLVFGVIALLGIYFLLIFNSQNSSYVICDSFSSICAENTEIVCDGVTLKAWEAIMYLLGLCFSIIGTTLLIRNTSSLLKGNKTATVEPEIKT
jgi:uncharacterized membrane protein